MSDPQRDRALLVDMLEYARKVVAATRDWTEDDMLSTTLEAAGIERWIEIIGEAARGVSPETKASQAHVVWKQIITTRHIIAHDYGRVNRHVLWRIARVHLPILIQQLEGLISPFPPDPEP